MRVAKEKSPWLYARRRRLHRCVHADRKKLELYPKIRRHPLTIDIGHLASATTRDKTGRPRRLSKSALFPFTPKTIGSAACSLNSGRAMPRPPYAAPLAGAPADT